MRDLSTTGNRWPAHVPLFEAYIEWRDDVRAGRLQLDEADSKWDFPSFLFGPVRQSMYAGYDEVESQYRRYARVESAPDFRERRIYGLNGFTAPGYIGDKGEAPPMTRSERPSAALVVDTYGGVYSMTRQLIINDESNELLNTAPDEMGRSAANFITETIVALVESNPTAPDGNPMWSVARGNQLTDPLHEDSLATALSRFTKQRDDIGRRITMRVGSLLVGDPRVQMEADRIITSTTAATNIQYAGAARAGSGIFDKGNFNPLSRALTQDQIVYDPFLSDANDWYLFADPQRTPAFAVGFLNGQEQPQVFLKNPEMRNVLGGGGQDPYTFEMLTLDWLVRFDFGVAPVDPRGTLRSIVP